MRMNPEVHRFEADLGWPKIYGRRKLAITRRQDKTTTIRAT
jgi:hypothetical protein